MRSRIMKRMSAGVTAAGVTAAGLAFLFSGPAWAASSPQPASGTFLVTSATVNSVSTADGNTIVVLTVSGITTGTIDGSFTETDREGDPPGVGAREQGRGIRPGPPATGAPGPPPY